jgi:hypothetical protein
VSLADGCTPAVQSKSINCYLNVFLQERGGENILWYDEESASVNRFFSTSLMSDLIRDLSVSGGVVVEVGEFREAWNVLARQAIDDGVFLLALLDEGAHEAAAGHGDGEREIGVGRRYTVGDDDDGVLSCPCRQGSSRSGGARLRESSEPTVRLRCA